METSLLSLPETPGQLGEKLRGWRTQGPGTWPLTVQHLESDQENNGYPAKWSAQALEDFEGGQLPALRDAAALDRLYGANGWIALGLRSLYRDQWEPWAQDHGVADHHHRGVWPGRYEGPVWVKLMPLPEHISRKHLITCLWGPNRHKKDYELTEEGLILVTGKTPHPPAEGAREFILRAELPVFALFGAGKVPRTENLHSIRNEWRKR